MIGIITGKLLSLFLISIRVGTIFIFSPIEALKALPISARLSLSLIISILIMPYCQFSEPSTLWSLTEHAFFEGANGLIFLILLYMAYSVFYMAGQWIDTQSGLNAITLFNPKEYIQESFSSRLLLLLVGLFFFTTNSHHKVIKMLVYSFKTLPLGEFIFYKGIGPVLSHFSFIFMMAIVIAFPIVFFLILIDILSLILSRNMPQSNSYFLFLPIKVLISLYMFAMILPYISPLWEYIFNNCFIAAYKGFL